jgi:hypothetical protein
LAARASDGIEDVPNPFDDISQVYVATRLSKLFQQKKYVYTLIHPSAPATIRFNDASCSKHVIAAACPVKNPRHSPVTGFQMRIVESAAAETKYFDVISSKPTRDVCPSRRWRAAPVAVHQMRTVASKDPETARSMSRANPTE